MIRLFYLEYQEDSRDSTDTAVRRENRADVIRLYATGVHDSADICAMPLKLLPSTTMSKRKKKSFGWESVAVLEALTALLTTISFSTTFLVCICALTVEVALISVRPTLLEPQYRDKLSLRDCDEEKPGHTYGILAPKKA